MRRRTYFNDEYAGFKTYSIYKFHMINPISVYYYDNFAMTYTVTINLSKIFNNTTFKPLPPYLDKYKYSPHYDKDFDISIMYCRENNTDKIMEYIPYAIENENTIINYDYIKAYLNVTQPDETVIINEFYTTMNNSDYYINFIDCVTLKKYKIWREDNTTLEPDIIYLNSSINKNAISDNKIYDYHLSYELQITI